MAEELKRSVQKSFMNKSSDKTSQHKVAKKLVHQNKSAPVLDAKSDEQLRIKREQLARKQLSLSSSKSTHVVHSTQSKPKDNLQKKRENFLRKHISLDLDEPTMLVKTRSRSVMSDKECSSRFQASLLQSKSEDKKDYKNSNEKELIKRMVNNHI